MMVALGILANATGAAAQDNANEMLKSVNAYVNFQDSVTAMQMQVLRQGKVEAEYDMRVHKLDSQRMRIEFLRPVREKGRRILRVGDKMWMFLPDLGKPIVISARQSFLGSSFSNGDLLRTDLVADYTAQVMREEALDGIAVQVLELRARRAEVAYDRIVLWIDKRSKRPLRQEFFTLSGKRIKVMHYSKPAQFDGVEVSTEMKVESDLNPHEHTLLTISGLALRQKLSNALFQKDSFDR
jgi:outer membrane lipoprotein-sorting protein